MESVVILSAGMVEFDGTRYQTLATGGVCGVVSGVTWCHGVG